MKRYKLLKDLPFAKTGECFVYDEDRSKFFLLERDNLKKIHLNDIDDVWEWFEYFPQQYAWIPRVGEEFYFSLVSGEITSARWTPQNINTLGFKSGNFFKTEREALKRQEWLEAWGTLVNSSSFKPNWKDKEEVKYFIQYNPSKEKLLYSCTFSLPIISPCFFRTRIEVKDSLRRYQKEWKIILRVEE